MSLFNIFSGRIYRINKLAKEVINFNVEKISANADFQDTVLIMAASFAQNVLADIFNPKYNILLKQVNQIDEDDINSIFCVLVAHLIYRFFGKPFLFYKLANDPNGKDMSFDKNYTLSKFEKELGYTTDEYKKFETREVLWSKNFEGIDPEVCFGMSDGKIMDSPTIKMIANHCHIYSDAMISKKIMVTLLNSYNYTKKVFNTRTPESEH